MKSKHLILTFKNTNKVLAMKFKAKSKCFRLAKEKNAALALIQSLALAINPLLHNQIHCKYSIIQSFKKISQFLESVTVIKATQSQRFL